jgi:hypothetical protein
MNGLKENKLKNDFYSRIWEKIMTSATARLTAYLTFETNDFLAIVLTIQQLLKLWFCV